MTLVSLHFCCNNLSSIENARIIDSYKLEVQRFVRAERSTENTEILHRSNPSKARMKFCYVLFCLVLGRQVIFDAVIQGTEMPPQQQVSTKYRSSGNTSGAVLRSGHVIAEMDSGHGHFVCAATCLSTPACKGINFGAGGCELLDTNYQIEPQLLEGDGGAGYTHYWDVGATCPHGWKQWKSHCYFASNTGRGLQSAIDLCAEKGAHLVSIRSAEEQEFIKNELAVGYKYWTALTDRDEECGEKRSCSGWRFLHDNSTLDWPGAWGPNEPRATKGELEHELDCVTLFNPTYIWKAASCRDSANTICKK